MVAIESRKHAARRPKPPLPSPASGSCSINSSQSIPCSRAPSGKSGSKQQVGDVVGQRTSDEKLHGEVIDAFGILSLISALGQHPTLSENVSHGMGKRLKALTRTRYFGIDRSVKNQVPFIKSVFRPDKRHRAVPVLLQNI